VPREPLTLEQMSTVLAAIQAAALAGDYPLAISLLREYKLEHRCLACVGDCDEGYKWRFGVHAQHVLFTCRSCTENFALWYVSKSPARQLFDGALHGMAAYDR